MKKLKGGFYGRHLDVIIKELINKVKENKESMYFEFNGGIDMG
jgi:hypothetical protein